MSPKQLLAQCDRSLLDKLPYRQREILKLRYGLDGEFKYSLGEVAGIFKITPERVRQVQNNALRRLRKLFAQYGSVVAAIHDEERGF
jgi:RNA polymerase primary sigma factor